MDVGSRHTCEPESKLEKHVEFVDFFLASLGKELQYVILLLHYKKMHTQFDVVKMVKNNCQNVHQTSKTKFLELAFICCGGRTFTWSAQLQVMAFVAEEDGAKHIHEGAITVDELKVSINYLRAFCFRKTTFIRTLFCKHFELELGFQLTFDSLLQAFGENFLAGNV